MDTLFKKRLIGATVLLLLLAVLLPAFLTGSGDALRLPDSTSIPDPPEYLQAKLGQQIALSRQLRERLDNTVVTTGIGGQSVVSKAIPVPEPTAESHNEDIFPDGATNVTETVTGTEQLADEEKVASNDKKLDVIERLEQNKRVKWVVQLGAFQNLDNADKMMRKLRDNTRGYELFLQKRDVDGNNLHIVFTGPILSKEKAEKRQQFFSSKFKIKSVVKIYNELGIAQ